MEKEINESIQKREEVEAKIKIDDVIIFID